MNKLIEILISMHNKSKSLETINAAKSFQAYDDELCLIIENDLNEPADLIEECKYRHMLMFAKTISKEEIQNDLRLIINRISELKDNPAAIAALCKIYGTIIANFYFANQLKTSEAQHDIIEAKSLLSKVVIETDDSVNLRKLLDEIKH